MGGSRGVVAISRLWQGKTLFLGTKAHAICMPYHSSDEAYSTTKILKTITQVDVSETNSTKMGA